VIEDRGNGTNRPYEPRVKSRVLRPSNPAPKKKRITLVIGVILAVLGLCGVVLAIVVYPTWTHNRQVMSEYEAYGRVPQDIIDTVAVQDVVVFGGFLVGGPMLLVGILLIASAMIYNSKLDTAILQHSFTQDVRPSIPRSGQLIYCSYCGNPTEGKPYCAYCGKKT
jgi:hypothetical protein